MEIAACNEDKMQSNDDCFPYLAEKNFEKSYQASHLAEDENAANDLFPYVNAITILVSSKARWFGG